MNVVAANPAQTAENLRTDRTWFIILWVVCLAGACSSLPLRNGWLGTFSFLVLAICITTVWRRGEPQIFVIALGIQWIQAGIAIHYADFFDLDVDFFLFQEGAATASALTLLSLAVLAIGIRVGVGKSQPKIVQRLLDQLRSMPVRRLMWLWTIAVILSQLAGPLAGRLGGLRSFVEPFRGLSLAVLCVFGFKVFLERRGYGAFATVLLGEVFLGFLGFFGKFSSPLMVAVAAWLGSLRRFNPKGLIVGVPLVGVFAALVVLWMTIKWDYRDFLNHGERTQAVQVSIPERIHKLVELFGSVSYNDLEMGIDALVNRATYVTFFGAALQHVPHHTPHENGKLWLGAVTHVFTPRVLFPKKPVIRESERTMKYTGLSVAGIEQGTSISLGYPADSYVDFGYFMFVPIFLFGLFCGLIYRIFACSPEPAIGIGLLVPTLMTNFLVESSNIKLVGGMLSHAIVLYVCHRLFSRKVREWVIGRSKDSDARTLASQTPELMEFRRKHAELVAGEQLRKPVSKDQSPVAGMDPA